MNNITIILAILIAQLFALAAGFWLGRNTKPWRKTRYFVNEFGWLCRWKYSEPSSVFGEKVGWCKTGVALSCILKDCQEIDSLTAYRMFPRAFKK